MPPEPVFSVTYWGTTGSFPAPLLPHQVTDKLIRSIELLVTEGELAKLTTGPDLRTAIERQVMGLPFHLRSTFGGNTTCIEVQTSDSMIILDCGSGFRDLGRSLAERWNAPGYQGPREAHILVTHPHMDHTFATPFFGPYYDPRNRFTIWGSPLVIASLEAVLHPESRLANTYFPPTFALMKGLAGFRTVEAGQTIEIAGVLITTCALCHPGGCMGYRLERAGKILAFASDHEQPQTPDPILMGLARNADLLYTEGQYLLEEYDGRQGLPGEAPMSRHGWGHTPVESCVRTALAAGVRRLHVGHRDPVRTDEDLTRIEVFCRQFARELLREAGREADSLEVAIPYEGLTVQV
jgi:phosphoribosyl 1,2-cyclic phosphodiesterase